MFEQEQLEAWPATRAVLGDTGLAMRELDDAIRRKVVYLAELRAARAAADAPVTIE